MRDYPPIPRRRCDPLEGTGIAQQSLEGGALGERFLACGRTEDDK